VAFAERLVDQRGSICQASPFASVPDSSMSFGFAGNCTTTRARPSGIVKPACAAICRNAAASSACGRSPDRLRGGVHIGFERLNPQRHCVRRDVLAEARVRTLAGRATAPATATAAEQSAEAAGHVQHRRLVEVDRQIGLVVAVDQRALLVGDLGAQIDPRTKRRAGSSTVTPLVMAYSGKIVAVDPSVISVPPSCTNFASSSRPGSPMPPRISSL
jgi:hypothetical protein